MARGLFIQAASGIAGDMFLAALLDLGLDLDDLRRALEATALSPFRLEARERMQGAVRATKLDVHVQRADGSEVQEGRDANRGDDHHHHGDHDHHHGHHHHGHDHHHAHSHHDPDDAHGHDWRAIDARIATAPMSERARERARAIFRTLAGAEARIHAVAPEDVHFHEVGALDSVLDICGAALALDILQIDEVTCDVIGVGQGTRRTAHGELPVPTPATAEILRGLPLRSTGVADELVTPTGAAILKVLVDRFESPGPHRLIATGYGSGSTHRADPPNVVRVSLYETATETPSAETEESDEVVVLETHIDDMSAEALGFLRERLEAAGALDVGIAPLQMKKNRPGQAVVVIIAPDDEARVGEVLLRESSTFGYRRRTSERRTLARETQHLPTPWGSLRVKIGRRGGAILRRVPEYEDLARIARENDLTLAEVEHRVSELIARAFPISE